jgi:hypothetical protein
MNPSPEEKAATINPALLMNPLSVVTQPASSPTASCVQLGPPTNSCHQLLFQQQLHPDETQFLQQVSDKDLVGSLCATATLPKLPFPTPNPDTMIQPHSSVPVLSSPKKLLSFVRSEQLKSMLLKEARQPLNDHYLVTISDRRLKNGLRYELLAWLRQVTNS